MRDSIYPNASEHLYMRHIGEGLPRPGRWEDQAIPIVQSPRLCQHVQSTAGEWHTVFPLCLHAGSRDDPRTGSRIHGWQSGITRVSLYVEYSRAQPLRLPL